ncbi:MAG: P-II family nitrogen regulator [Blastochloris sp.]|nr:P-II family nitrogen regulator [Blastochloris sp.]
MTPYKKIEVITSAVELGTIEKKLHKAGITGYTIIRDVIGSGNRGRHAGDELTGVFTNVYVLIACPPSNLDKVVEAIRPIIKIHGGVCLVSDVQSLKS